MEYPVEILPNHNYKKINLADVQDLYLIRNVIADQISDFFDESLNQVKSDSIASPTANLRDLSTSLLGVFAYNHTKIELTNDGKAQYAHYCEPNETVSLPIEDVHFQILKNRFFWVVKISDIIDQKAEYSNPNNGITFNATCLIEHTPMKWNFWHFSIRWKLEDGRFWHELSQNEINKYSKKIGHESKSIISKFAKIFIEKFEVIKPDKFQNI